MRSLFLPVAILTLSLSASHLAVAGVDMVDNTTHAKTKKTKVKTVTTVSTSVSTSSTVAHTGKASQIFLEDDTAILAPIWIYDCSRPVAPLASGTLHMLKPTAKQLEEREKYGTPPTKPMPLDTTLMVYIPKEQPVP